MRAKVNPNSTWGGTNLDFTSRTHTLIQLRTRLDEARVEDTDGHALRLEVDRQALASNVEPCFTHTIPCMTCGRALSKRARISPAQAQTKPDVPQSAPSDGYAPYDAPLVLSATEPIRLVIRRICAWWCRRSLGVDYVSDISNGRTRPIDRSCVVAPDMSCVYMNPTNRPPIPDQTLQPKSFTREAIDRSRVVPPYNLYHSRAAVPCSPS